MPYQALIRACIVLITFALVSCGRQEPLVELEPRRSAPTVIANVGVFDAGNLERRADLDVWIEGERITRIVPAGSVVVPEEARLIDGAGRTLLPGLIDAHVHVTNSDAPPGQLDIPDPERNLQQFLYTGITTAIDLGGPGQQLKELQRELRSGHLAGPDLLYTGRMLTIEDGFPIPLINLALPWPVDWLVVNEKTHQVDSPATVEQAIESLLQVDAGWAKLMLDDVPLGAPRFSEALFSHAVESARAAGLPTMVHIGADEDARLAAKHGANMLVHGNYLDTYSDRTLSLLAEKDIAVIPTVGVFRNMARVLIGGYTPPDFFEELQAPEQVADLTAGYEGDLTQAIRPWLNALQDNQDHLLSNARILGERGITWLVGSDSPFLGWTAGQALHTELVLLVQAGYSPAEVLQAATLRNARAMGLDDRGQIAEGLRADLLLVRGDPTEAIANIHNIEAVFKAGRRVRRHTP